VKGRKRHVLVDTLGLLLVIAVTSAGVQDRDGAKLLFRRLTGPCKKLRCGGYRGGSAEMGRRPVSISPAGCLAVRQSKRVQVVASALGCGTHFRMAQPQPQTRQRLRNITGNLLNIRLYWDDPVDA
jgi:hypothetical protein